MDQIDLTGKLIVEKASERLDQALARTFPDYSRSRLQQWIKAGYVQIAEKIVTDNRQKVYGGEAVAINAHMQSEVHWRAQEIPLDIVFEDEEILVINKPADLVVHPAAGNYDGTLVNGLLHYLPELEAIPRAGVVHRLDKDTSGLMVVAKTLSAQNWLVNELKSHSVERQYECLVYGHIIAGATIDQPIGRNPRNRLQMAVVANGKASVTHFRVAEKFIDFSLLDVFLETGRTHQIRVHMSYNKHPIVGDPVYGKGVRLPKGCSDALKDALHSFKRQALHAKRLSLVHPSSKKSTQWQVERPHDFQHLMDILHQEGSQDVG
jgi:23S rRNA pseudouridine1911/1915/1917 synthase